MRYSIFKDVTNDCCFPSANQSFTLSFHNHNTNCGEPHQVFPGQNVRVQWVYMENLDQPGFGCTSYPNNTCNSYGAIMAEYKENVRVLDAVIKYKRPNRPVVQLHDNTNVYVRRCEIQEGRVDIRNATKIRVSDCTGDADLYVDGVFVGKLSDGYSQG